MTTTPHAEEVTFVAAICADPADDTTRLVYADWLEEHGENVACGQCDGKGEGNWWKGVGLGKYAITKCPTCHGTGRVSDGRRERSEFIKVQIALNIGMEEVGLHPVGDASVAAYAYERKGWRHNNLHPRQVKLLDLSKLQVREAQLFDAHGLEWMNRPVGKRFMHRSGTHFTFANNENESRDVWTYRRGFIDSIRCSTADFLTHAAAVFRAMPVTGVTLADVRISHREDMWGWRWNWPVNVRQIIDPRRSMGYRTKADVESRLSAACVTWARAQVGLPKLEGEKR